MEEKIIYESEKFNLCGLLSRRNDNDLIVVLCHGYLGDKNETGLFDMLKIKLIEENLNSFRFDFRAHGESSGNDDDISLTGEIKDLENTLDMLKMKGFNKFILVGSSLGGAIVSLIDHSKYNILNMIIWYGALDFNKIKKGDFTKENMEIAKKNGYYIKYSKHNNNYRKISYQLFKDFDTYKPYVNLQKLDFPILLIHGTKDELVNYESSINTHKLYKNSKLIIIENAKHLFIDSIENRNYAINETVNFIKEHI
ncbi:MAG: alpha/beta hydrolase [Bacilli bacterium]